MPECGFTKEELLTLFLFLRRHDTVLDPETYGLLRKIESLVYSILSIEEIEDLERRIEETRRSYES